MDANPESTNDHDDPEGEKRSTPAVVEQIGELMKQTKVLYSDMGSAMRVSKSSSAIEITFSTMRAWRAQVASLNKTLKSVSTLAWAENDIHEFEDATLKAAVQADLVQHQAYLARVVERFRATTNSEAIDRAETHSLRIDAALTTLAPIAPTSYCASELLASQSDAKALRLDAESDDSSV